MSLKKARTGIQDSRISGLWLALTGYLVLLNRLFAFSGPQFPNLWDGNDNSFLSSSLDCIQ